MAATEITFDNFKDYLGKEVYLEWSCKWGGMMYPEHNILIGMSPDRFYLKTVEDSPQDVQYWDAPVDAGEDADIGLYDYKQYKGLSDGETNPSSS